MSGTQSSTTSATPGTWITQSINGMQYDVLLPANYDPSVKYPTVLYLHQLDMGDDPSGLLAEVNPWFNSTAFRTDYPAIVVMPLLDQTADPSGQTINFGGVSTADSAGEDNAIAALQQVQAQYGTDPNRAYVTGNSLGGIGTEDMLIKYNAYTGTEGKIFAAALSLAGADYGQNYPNPTPALVQALKNVPYMAIHGGQDTTVPLTWDQNLYAAEQAVGGDMIYTQNNSLGHDVWDTYFPQTGPGSPLNWLFSQSTNGTVAPGSTDTSTGGPSSTGGSASGGSAPGGISATPSTNDTIVVAGSDSSITDAGGNVWTITSGGQVAVNGTADTTTANVTHLAYVGGEVWQENASALWWGKTSASAAWSPTAGTATSPLPVAPTPPPSSQPSANDTVVLPGSGKTITDASGNLWTITGTGQVAVNGTADTTTANVIELAYVNKTIWQENASNLWWGESAPNGGWSPTAGTATSPLPAVSTPPATPQPSANDTVVLPGSGKAITDAGGNLWTITGTGQVAVNGTADTTTANVIELAYVNKTIWQENASNLWWGETTPNGGWAPTAGTATSPLPAVSTPPATPQPSANDTAVLPGSGKAITDASGNLWTITSTGQVAVNGTADTTTANVIELAYVNKTIWQENASNLWWGETTPNGGWAPTAGTATSPLPASSGSTTGSGSTSGSGTGSGSTSGSGTGTTTGGGATAPGTRDPSQTPFASNSVFNQPLGSGAQWQYNAQLAGSNAFINTATGSGYNENIYTGTASDPLVTITNTAGAGGTAGTFQVHIPVGAAAAPGGDQTFSVDDTTTHTWYSFGGFNWTGSNTATVSQGSGESDYGSGITVDGSDWDEGVGTLRESDLQAGTIDHMLRMELPIDMLMSVSSSAYQLASYAWPQTQEDGNGPSVYTGTIPYGVTIGIAASAVEPTAVKANAGADMLWKALQDHGAMVRDSGGSGNTVIFQADQNVSPNDPLIQGMIQYSAQIMASAEILANQGPNSINGGGTPIVPLDSAPSDLPSSGTASTGTSSTGSGSASGSSTGSGSGTTPPATGTGTATPSSNDTVLFQGSNAAITDAAGHAWTIVSGQVAVDGVVDTTTSQVTELAYVNGAVWQENSSALWWDKTSPSAAWSSGNGTSTNPLPAPTAMNIADTQTSVTVSGNVISAIATGGSHMVLVTGTGNTINLTHGGDTITDSAGSNTFILPPAGQGYDSFTTNILTDGDQLNLVPALAATNWNGSAATLAQYLSVTDTPQGAILSISATSGGAETAFATIGGTTSATLTGILAHSTT